MNYKDNIFRFVYVCLAAVTPLSESVAEPFQPDGTTTFATAENPVMWADYPDPDVIRVGDWFYMMSTTMHLMPGAPVMRSKDLVSWELVSYLFDRLEDTPKYDIRTGRYTDVASGRLPCVGMTDSFMPCSRPMTHRTAVMSIRRKILPRDGHCTAG